MVASSARYLMNQTSLGGLPTRALPFSGPFVSPSAWGPTSLSLSLISQARLRRVGPSLVFLDCLTDLLCLGLLTILLLFLVALCSRFDFSFVSRPFVPLSFVSLSW